MTVIDVLLWFITMHVGAILKEFVSELLLRS